MKFDVAAWLMNPFILMFISVFIGMLFGKIKFGKFNFGVSGTLFAGLLIGWWVLGYAKGFAEGDAGYSSAQKLIKTGVIDKGFFYLFLILFVAAVGLLAAKDMGTVLKKYGAKFVLLGFFITFLGAASTYGMTLMSPLLGVNSNPYEVSGVYTGALTSSPGLAAAIETARGHAMHKAEVYDTLKDEDKAKILNVIDSTGKLTPENTPLLSEAQKAQLIKNAEAGIGVGHAIGYPIGVLIVILCVNFFPKIFGMDVQREQEQLRKEMAAAKSKTEGKEIEETSFDLTAFAIACFFGYTIGKIKIYLPYLGDFGLGSTGGVLIGSLILGHIGKIGFLNFRMNNKILGVVRQLSLAFFLAIVGLRYGFKVFDAVFGGGWYLAVVALVVGIMAMTIGFFVGRYVLKINWIMLSGAICGGMTSTPGLGAAVDAIGSDDPAAGYGATYPAALLGMVIFTIILHNLPM
ncbi:hypothetical protein [Crassaminicella indica]|uniref:YidE/YbjL duplication domain-containing protein n=1 Tax=Crassaminicella indica TaxID=2855394 RepID=A0ABX8REL5_9CLOT|nr:hypothetical protein [Crassaminicella indica]QXM07246.1 hypothetical protein KVH43_06025 [Crassaminicella indica]